MARRSQSGALERYWEKLALAMRAIRHGEERDLVEALERLSRRSPRLAVLAFLGGGVGMLFSGLKLLVLNWRLTVVQVVPAAWIWLAMYDLRLHLLRGNTASGVEGPLLVPIVLAIVAVTVGCFFLNAVFGFAVVQQGQPRIRPAIAEARRHLAAILLSGAAVGLALGLSTTVVARAGRPWFALALGATVGVMMVAYVAVPSRLVGVKPTGSRRDRLSATALGTALGVVVSAPPYVLGRVGLLMLGSPILFVPGLVLFLCGAALQMGATGAVKAMKLGTRLRAGRAAPGPPPASGR